MNIEKFNEGFLQWRAETMTPEAVKAQFLEQEWDDGFLAFSNSERRLGGDGLSLLGAFLNGRADRHGGPEGYLMEAGLWRSRGAVLEEISLEREGDNFFVQHWVLQKNVSPKESNCYWRKAETFVRGNLGEVFSGAVKTVEVIVPEHRLHLYLTREASV
ncbi:MAG TPA: hypothetical protein PK175_09085 [Syntrophales bacterium]|jgi:hypothetical protein|nr:hypothetical protein [Syntrophales bacterium]HOU77615.1 hypothetical protein [Syntrophales bacterium]HPC32372.1 hypothetical protein [Syntrophales bacterium]HQG35012.1 hypothetical protein [Syntrophales bacterium]HQI36596.1 hypothetical protein [Syntrophales bacterium]